MLFLESQNLHFHACLKTIFEVVYLFFCIKKSGLFYSPLEILEICSKALIILWRVLFTKNIFKGRAHRDCLPPRQHITNDGPWETWEHMWVLIWIRRHSQFLSYQIKKSSSVLFLWITVEIVLYCMNWLKGMMALIQTPGNGDRHLFLKNVLVHIFGLKTDLTFSWGNVDGFQVTF